MIIKRKYDSNFTAIPNAIIDNRELSAEARWVLIYLLSKPKDWVVRVTDIRAAGNLGRDKAYSIMKELVEARYVEKVQGRNEDGSYGDAEYLVVDQPLPEKPYPAEPNPVNQELSKDLVVVSIDNTNSVLAKASTAPAEPDARDILWSKIPLISSATGIPQSKLRPIVGRWLKTLDDNASLLCQIIDDALEFRPADFVGFVGGSIKDRGSKEKKKESWLELWK